MKPNAEQLISILKLSTDDTDYEYGDKRAILNEPFIQGDYAVASDGHRIITLPLDLFETTPDFAKSDYPNVERVFKGMEDKANEVPTVINVSAMKRILKRVSFVTHCKCKECNGTGNVMYTYEAETDDCEYTQRLPCPICGGCGSVEIDRQQAEAYPIYIEGRMITSDYLKWLCDMTERLGWHFVNYWGNKGIGAYFKKDGIRLAITEASLENDFDSLVEGYELDNPPKLTLVK